MKKYQILLLALILVFSVTMSDLSNASAKSKTIIQEQGHYLNYEEDGKIKTKDISKTMYKEMKRIDKEYRKLEKDLAKKGKLDEENNLIGSPITTYRIVSCISPDLCLEDGGGGSKSLKEVSESRIASLTCDEDLYYLCRTISYYSGSTTYHELTVEIDPMDNTGHLENKLVWDDSPLYLYDDYMSVFIDEKVDVILSTINLNSEVDFTAYSGDYGPCYSDGNTNGTYSFDQSGTSSNLEIPNAGTNSEGFLWTINPYGSYDQIHADEPAAGFGYPMTIPNENASGDTCTTYKNVVVHGMIYTMSFDFILDSDDYFYENNSYRFTSQYSHKIMGFNPLKLINGFSVELSLTSMTQIITESLYYEVDGIRELDIQILF